LREEIIVSNVLHAYRNLTSDGANTYNWDARNRLVLDAVQAAPDGLSLVPYNGPPLTVGGELNKLASNIAIGRNFAGVHWRSDATESLKLGEEVAIRYLMDERH